jgi:hypothetical protein
LDFLFGLETGIGNVERVEKVSDELDPGTG